MALLAHRDPQVNMLFLVKYPASVVKKVMLKGKPNIFKAIEVIIERPYWTYKMKAHSVTL